MNNKIKRQAYLALSNAILIMIMAFSLMVTQPAQARPSAEGEVTRYVSTVGSDTTACDVPETPCFNINYAISQAADGDTVKVAVGTYTSASGAEVVLINKSIILSGGWDDTFTAQSGMSTLDGGNARRGITINSAITAEINRIIITNGSYFSIGGIYNHLGNLTINNSSIYANKRIGVYNYLGNMTVNNSTISSNTGEGVYSDSGSIIINNSTIAKNQSYSIVSALAIISLQNTIVSKNDTTSNCHLISGGTITSQGYNLIDDTLNCAIAANVGDLFNVDPQLYPFVEYTGTHPLNSSSPAIDAGDNNTCYGISDQRGLPRVDGPDADSDITCDIGAYEFSPAGEPASIHPVSGGNQYTHPNTVFPQPLKARVLDSNGTTVGSGIEVVFTAPIDGPSGTFDGGDNSITVLTNEFGVATTPDFTANSELGEYKVYANTDGAVSAAEFIIKNSGWFVSPTGSETNGCQYPSDPCPTINAALAKVRSGDTIKVTIGTYTAVSGTEWY